MLAGSGNDIVEGGSDDDIILGNSGDDILTGGTGDDTLRGGAGSDGYQYVSGDGNDSIIDDGTAWADADTLNLSDLLPADVTLSRDGDDLLIHITATSRTIRVANQFRYELDPETFNADGLEQIVFSDSTTWDRAQIATEAGLVPAGAVITGSADADVLRGDADQNEILGLAGGDTIRGEGGADTIEAGDGADVVYGGGGDDTLVGGADSDSLYGGKGYDVFLAQVGDGDDLIDGGDGIDTIDYSALSTSIAVDLAAGTASGADIGSDTLVSIESIWSGAGDDTLRGSALHDELYGGGGDDHLAGRQGADFLFGDDGDDYLEGGAGADMLDGGLGNDTASYVTSSAAVTINLATGAAAGGDAQGDAIYDVENVVGSAFADTLTGNSGVNVLAGGGGDDILAGGGGNDTFVFQSGFGHDTIVDFSAGAGDVVEFQDGVFADFAAVQAASSQVGSDVLITVDASNSILLTNVTLAGLQQSNFLFV